MSVYIADKSQITRHIPNTVWPEETVWRTSSEGGAVGAPVIYTMPALSDERISTATATVIWLTVKVSSILSSNDAVAAALYEKAINLTITPYELRSHTPNQLYCLRIKLSTNPPVDTHKKAITQLFERAMCIAHRDGDSEAIQIALWDLYTLEHMEHALTLFPTTSVTRNLVAAQIAQIFTTLVADNKRRQWLSHIAHIDIAVRNTAMLFCSDEENARITFERLQGLSPEQQVQLLQQTNSLCIPRDGGSDRRIILWTLKMIPDVIRKEAVTDAKELCSSFPSADDRASLITYLSSVNKIDRTDIIKYIKALIEIQK